MLNYSDIFVCFLLGGLGVFVVVVVLSSFISHTCDNCLLHIRIDWLADSDTILHHQFYWRPFGRMIETSFSISFHACLCLAEMQTQLNLSSAKQEHLSADKSKLVSTKCWTVFPQHDVCIVYCFVKVILTVMK